VLETAFGLPSSFGTLDIDKQKDMLKQKAAAAFGDDRISQFADPARMDALIKRYLLRAQVAETTAMAPSSVALNIVTQLAARMKR
jgi:hypothetical protein